MERGRALTVADALIGLAVLSLIAALLWPTLTHRRFDGTVEETIARIDDARGRALLTHQQTGEWPPEMATDSIAHGPQLDWHVWMRVEHVVVPAPPRPQDADPGPASDEPVTMQAVRPFGALAVTSGDEPLLAALLDHYGRDRSFVRDSTWTLVLQPGRSTP